MENEPIRVMNYQPKLFEILEDKDSIKLLDDENYKIILEILNNQSMTVKELTTEFERQTGHSKSSKSIYRYISKLKSAKLITNIGQLVTTGKLYTEAIFAPTAMTYYKKTSDPKFWDTSDGKKSLEGIYFLLKHSYDFNFTIDNLKVILKNIDGMDISQIFNLDNFNQDEYTKFISDLSVNNFNTIINYSKILLILFNEKFNLNLNHDSNNNFK